MAKGLQKDYDQIEKGCPFCECTGVMEHRKLKNKTVWFVKCDQGACGAEGPKHSDANEAIKAWNDRA